MSGCLFSFYFIGHILAQIKICHNWVHVLNFLVTFLLLTTNTALYLMLFTSLIKINDCHHFLIRANKRKLGRVGMKAFFAPQKILTIFSPKRKFFAWFSIPGQSCQVFICKNSIWNMAKIWQNSSTLKRVQILSFIAHLLRNEIFASEYKNYYLNKSFE